MHNDPRRVNYFLIIYLILYLCLSIGGSLIFQQTLLSRILQFLPLVLGIIYLLITRQPVLSSVQLRSFHPLTIPCIIAFTFCLLPMVSVVNMVSLLFSHNLVSNSINSTVFTNGLIYSLITMALFPAIVEEFTFRGVVYGQYRCNRPMKAMLLSSLCFGLMHMNINQFCYAFVLGIILSLLVEATGSLIPSILMHFTFNAFSVVSVYLNQQSTTYIPSTESTQISLSDFTQSLPVLLPFVIIGCILAFLLYRIMIRLNRRNREIAFQSNRVYNHLQSNVRLTNVCFYCFVIICILICIIMEVFSYL